MIIHYLIKILIIFCALISNLLAIENKIIFKINNKIYTSLDFENRVIYLELLEDNTIDKNNIMDDLISATIFYEYYKKNIINNINFEYKISQIYKENFELIENISDNNNLKKQKFLKIKKKNIIKNLELDIVRKEIIENLLNEEKDLIFSEPNQLDIIYEFKIKYISLSKIEFKKINQKFNIVNKSDFNEFEEYLKKNNIVYLTKSKEITDIDSLDNNLKENIIDNKKIIIKENENFVSIILIEKKLESYDNVTVELVSLETSNKINKTYLNCNKIEMIDDNEIIKLNKNEYIYNNLNNEIKNNLFNIDDYLIFKNNNKYIYIFLCKMNFDQKILNEINLGKKISKIALEIENKFIKKYKKIFNFTKYYE